MMAHKIQNKGRPMLEKTKYFNDINRFLNIFGIIIRYIIQTIVWLWHFLFFFFGITYEKQASKLKLDELDHAMRGHKNEKTTHQIYRANKVGKAS